MFRIGEVVNGNVNIFDGKGCGKCACHRLALGVLAGLSTFSHHHFVINPKEVSNGK